MFAGSLSLTHVTRKLAAAHADGSTSIFDVKEDGDAEVRVQWTEHRLKESQKFVGLAFEERYVI